MASIHEIAIGLDAQPFERGMRAGIIEPTDAAAKALDKLGTETVTAGREGTREMGKLEDALRKAQKQTDYLDRSADKVKRHAADMGDDGARSLGRLGDKGAEIGDELRQNIGETFSSFKGDLADLPQLAQDTLGGLAGSGALGGIAGVAATAAGAAGLGLISAAMQQIAKDEEAAQQAAADWADKFIESGQRVATAGQQAAEMTAIYTDPEKYKTAAQSAKDWGVDVQTAVAAMAGNSTAIQAVTDSVNKLGDAARKRGDEARQGVGYEGALGAAVSQTQTQYDAARGSLDRLKDAQAEGRHRADEFSDSLLGIVSSAKDVGVEVDAVGNKVITLPDGKQIFIDAKTGQATTALDNFKGDADGVVDHINGRKVVIDADTSAAVAKLDALKRRVETFGGKLSVPRGILKEGWSA